jgi:arginase family enzyme
MSFDVDFLDPAFAPGHRHARDRRLLDGGGGRLLRALAAIKLVACDVVEVSPPYDGPGSRPRSPRRTSCGSYWRCAHSAR